MTAAERRISKVETGQRRMSDSVNSVANKLTHVSEKIDYNNELTEGIAQVINGVRGFVRFMSWCSRAVHMSARYVVLPLVLAYSIGYAVFHGGQFPPFWGTFMKAFL